MSSDFAPHGMTSGGHAPAAEATLANRVAGQAVMEKLLSQRVGLPPRS
ncbi:hypothetical protein ACQQCD_00815 [Pseudarthrobacter sp. J1763]